MIITGSYQIIVIFQIGHSKQLMRVNIYWTIITCQVLNFILWKCCCSVTQSCPALCNSMDCSMPGLLVLYSVLELAQTHVHWSVMSSNHLVLCHPLFLLPSIFPSIRVFSKELANINIINITNINISSLK